MSLPYNVSTLDGWWDDLYYDKPFNKHLQKPFPVMDSHPTFDIEEVREYFQDKLLIEELGAEVFGLTRVRLFVLLSFIVFTWPSHDFFPRLISLVE